MRDYFLIAIVLASLPIGVFKPFYGLLAYAWISYMYPHELAWSFAKTFPVAKLCAFSVMSGLFFSPAGNLAALWQRENISMLILWGTFTISSLFAFYPDQAWDRWQDVSKLILMSLVASVLLRDRRRVRQFLLVIAFSLGFYGFKGGLFGIATGGTEMVMGPGTSIIGANNAIGLALNMCLPLLWYLAREERGWRKKSLQAAFFLTIPAIMFTYSRASTLAMAVVLFAIMLKSRRRLVFIAAALIGGVAALPFIPQEWLDRQQSTLAYQEDGSAMSRIDNWKFCWKLAVDNPLNGAGFEFQSRQVFMRYAPEFLIKYKGKIWDTHNIFLGVLTCHGFPGLLAFASMIVFCFASCARLKRRVRHRVDLRWAGAYAEMIQLSFLAFLVNGMFVNMEYFDLPYHWVAVVSSLKVIVGRELSRSGIEEEYVADEYVAAAAS